MRKKLIIALVVLLAAGGAAYKMFAPKPPAPKLKVQGEVYVLPTDFLLTLSDGGYARLGVALILKPGETAVAGGGHGAPAKPPEGYGTLPQEPLVRTIITETVTGQPPYRLTDRKARAKLKHAILAELDRRTDVHAESVLFTDLAVQ